MPAGDIERDFPLLNSSNYQVISPEDFNYNCFAFALGDKRNWWEPPGLFGYYWPDGFAGTADLKTAVAIIRLHGFTLDVTASRTSETEAIAVYAMEDEWTHLARFSNGKWVSKLGEGHDITHSTLDVLEGDLFGQVAMVLARAQS